MFAVIKTGGKQYKVAENSILEIEKLEADEGEVVTFDEVLMIGGDKPQIGTPLLAGTAVYGEVLSQKRGDKVISFVKRRRKHSSQRRRGHRQYLTVVKITGIGGSKPAAKKAAAKKDDVKASDAPKKASKAEAAAEPAVAGNAPKNLLKEAKGDADDLSKISGVGPVLVKKLNALGVFHFWQIAEWNAEDIAYVDDHLSFKGRIERDNWIEQASELAKG